MGPNPSLEDTVAADAVAVGSVLSVGPDVQVSEREHHHRRHPPSAATAKSDDDDDARDNVPAQSNSGKPNPASADDASASEKSRLQNLKSTALRIFEAKHPGENRRELWEAMLDLIEVRAQERRIQISSAAYFVTALDRECAEIGADPEPAGVADSHENTEAPTEETWGSKTYDGGWWPHTYADIEELVFYDNPPPSSADGEIFMRARNRAHRKAMRFKNGTGEFRSLEKCREFIEMLQRVAVKEVDDNARRARMRERRAARKAVHRQSAPGESGELIQ